LDCLSVDSQWHSRTPSLATRDLHWVH
jgi:hypothetical protein